MENCAKWMECGYSKCAWTWAMARCIFRSIRGFSSFIPFTCANERPPKIEAYDLKITFADCFHMNTWIVPPRKKTTLAGKWKIPHKTRTARKQSTRVNENYRGFGWAEWCNCPNERCYRDDRKKNKRSAYGGLRVRCTLRIVYLLMTVLRIGSNNVVGCVFMCVCVQQQLGCRLVALVLCQQDVLCYRIVPLSWFWWINL